MPPGRRGPGQEARSLLSFAALCFCSTCMDPPLRLVATHDDSAGPQPRCAAPPGGTPERRWCVHARSSGRTARHSHRSASRVARDRADALHYRDRSTATQDSCTSKAYGNPDRLERQGPQTSDLSLVPETASLATTDKYVEPEPSRTLQQMMLQRSAMNARCRSARRHLRQRQRHDQRRQQPVSEDHRPRQ